MEVKVKMSDLILPVMYVGLILLALVLVVMWGISLMEV